MKHYKLIPRNIDKLKLVFHSILLVINILSLIILLQVVFQVIPYWECDWSTDKIARVNDMAKDFSITVISSTIFYLLLVVIPEELKRRQIRKRTQDAIDSLANGMQEIIAYLAYKCSISRKTDDPHYLKIEPAAFGPITDFQKNQQTGFYYSYTQNGKKELTNVSNWDEISYLYSRVCWLKRATLDYLDIPVIVYENPELVLLIRQIRRSSFIWDVEMKHSISVCTISKMNESIQVFYSLYLSLCKHVKHLQELNVGDEDAAKITPIAVKQ